MEKNLKDRKVLAIETCINFASVGYMEDGVIKYFAKLSEPQMQGEKLLPMIKGCFEKLSINFNKIDLIAITNGPGSFTGTRVGISSAYGIKLVTDIPIYTISTLEACFSKNYTKEKVAIAVSAGRGRYYVQKFNEGKIDSEITLEEENNIKNILQFSDELDARDILNAILIGLPLKLSEYPKQIIVPSFLGI